MIRGFICIFALLAHFPPAAMASSGRNLVVTTSALPACQDALKTAPLEDLVSDPVDGWAHFLRVYAPFLTRLSGIPSQPTPSAFRQIFESTRIWPVSDDLKFELTKPIGPGAVQVFRSRPDGPGFIALRVEGRFLWDPVTTRSFAAYFQHEAEFAREQRLLRFGEWGTRWHEPSEPFQSVPYSLKEVWKVLRVNLGIDQPDDTIRRFDLVFDHPDRPLFESSLIYGGFLSHWVRLVKMTEPVAARLSEWRESSVRTDSGSGETTRYFETQIDFHSGPGGFARFSVWRTDVEKSSGWRRQPKLVKPSRYSTQVRAFEMGDLELLARLERQMTSSGHEATRFWRHFKNQASSFLSAHRRNFIDPLKIFAAKRSDGELFVFSAADDTNEDLFFLWARNERVLAGLLADFPAELFEASSQIRIEFESRPPVSIFRLERRVTWNDSDFQIPVEALLSRLNENPIFSSEGSTPPPHAELTARSETSINLAEVAPETAVLWVSGFHLDSVELLSRWVYDVLKFDRLMVDLGRVLGAYGVALRSGEYNQAGDLLDGLRAVESWLERELETVRLQQDWVNRLRGDLEVTLPRQLTDFSTRVPEANGSRDIYLADVQKLAPTLHLTSANLTLQSAFLKAHRQEPLKSLILALRQLRAGHRALQSPGTSPALLEAMDQARHAMEALNRRQ